MAQAVQHGLTTIGALASRPSAFLIVIAYAGLWLIFSPHTIEWQAVATLATWLMTLFIQRAEHRDTQAIHAKLDELLHSQSSASDALTKLDDEEPEDIEAHRARHRGAD